MSTSGRTAELWLPWKRAHETVRAAVIAGMTTTFGLTEAELSVLVCLHEADGVLRAERHRRRPGMGSDTALAPPDRTGEARRRDARQGHERRRSRAAAGGPTHDRGIGAVSGRLNPPPPPGPDRSRRRGSTSRPSSSDCCRATKAAEPGRSGATLRQEREGRSRPHLAKVRIEAACLRRQHDAGNPGEPRGPGTGTAPDRFSRSGAVLTAHRAEAVGFEPTVTSLPRRFSRPFPSAARAHLPAPADDRRRGDKGNGFGGRGWGQLSPTREPRVSSVVRSLPSRS